MSVNIQKTKYVMIYDIMRKILKRKLHLIRNFPKYIVMGKIYNIQ